MEDLVSCAVYTIGNAKQKQAFRHPVTVSPYALNIHHTLSPRYQMAGQCRQRDIQRFRLRYRPAQLPNKETSEPYSVLSSNALNVPYDPTMTLPAPATSTGQQKESGQPQHAIADTPLRHCKQLLCKTCRDKQRDFLFFMR